MAFSAETKATLAKIADTAASNWRWAKPKKAIPWALIIEILMGLFNNCKPKTDQKADKTLRSVEVEVSENGVYGCCDIIIDRLPEKKQKRARKRLMAKIGAKDEAEADRRLYTAVMAVGAHREECCQTLASATENDEYEDDEEDDE